MRLATAWCASLASIVPALVVTPALAQSPMIQGWLFANTTCKNGAADQAKTQQACETRDRLGAKLERRGCVYREDGDWWKCHK